MSAGVRGWLGRVWLAAGLAGLAGGCTTESAALSDRCQLPAPVVEPAEAAPGASVAVRTGPLSATWDSAVLIGSARAEVTGLSREGCDACDACRDAAGCGACGACDGCEADCDLCVETLTVTVPGLAPGGWAVSVTNHYGASGAGSLTVTAADTAADSGDTAGADSGAP